MPVTDDAVQHIRNLIASGHLRPGDRLPQEAVLADQLGISRNSMREAVRALEQARVLTVRHGSGTYVTSLEPSLLLEGIAFAVDLLQDKQLPQVLEIRQLLEPAATGLAALRMTDPELEHIRGLLEQSRNLLDVEELVLSDIAFHAAITAAAKNAALSSILDGLSSRTVRLRIWGGIISNNAIHVTIEHHQQIFDALAQGDQVLAESAARVHISDARRWFNADTTTDDSAIADDASRPRASRRSRPDATSTV